MESEFVYKRQKASGPDRFLVVVNVGFNRRFNFIIFITSSKNFAVRKADFKEFNRFSSLHTYHVYMDKAIRVITIRSSCDISKHRSVNWWGKNDLLLLSILSNQIQLPVHMHSSACDYRHCRLFNGLFDFSSQHNYKPLPTTICRIRLMHTHISTHT